MNRYSSPRLPGSAHSVLEADGARLLLLCGSLRHGSTNDAVLRTVAAMAAPPVSCDRFAKLADLPHFNPDLDADPLHPAVAELRRGIATAHALLICTPEYAGALPGSFKNLLDWTIGGGEIYGKPVAWINASGRSAGGRGVHESLRKVLMYAGALIVEQACRHIPVARNDMGPHGLVENCEVRAAIRSVLDALTLALRTPGLQDGAACVRWS